jgi:hypothetical protein
MKCQLKGAIAAILMDALLAVPILTASAVSDRSSEQAPSLAGKATRRAGYSEMLARTAKKAKGKKRWLLRPGGDPGSSDFADLVVDSRGVVTVVWEDSTANPQEDIFYARSTDGGVTFFQGVEYIGQRPLQPVTPSALISRLQRAPPRPPRR